MPRLRAWRRRCERRKAAGAAVAAAGAPAAYAASAASASSTASAASFVNRPVLAEGRHSLICWSPPGASRATTDRLALAASRLVFKDPLHRLNRGITIRYSLLSQLHWSAAHDGVLCAVWAAHGCAR